MSDTSIANSPDIINRLTPRQRLVWERLTQPTPDALTPGGYVTVEYLAAVWGACLPGWKSLVRTNIANMNRRLEPLGILIHGRRRRGGLPVGYRVLAGVHREAQ